MSRMRRARASRLVGWASSRNSSSWTERVRQATWLTCSCGGAGMRRKPKDSRCFKAECAKGLVEIVTPPSPRLADLIEYYLNSLGLALRVASELGLALYPLGTYPLPISPVLRDDPGYRVKASTIGQERFSHAGRCAGAHLHLEVPLGTVWPDVKAALDAPSPPKGSCSTCTTAPQPSTRRS